MKKRKRGNAGRTKNAASAAQLPADFGKKLLIFQFGVGATDPLFHLVREIFGLPREKIVARGGAKQDPKTQAAIEGLSKAADSLAKEYTEKVGKLAFAAIAGGDADFFRKVVKYLEELKRGEVNRPRHWRFNSIYLALRGRLGRAPSQKELQRKLGWNIAGKDGKDRHFHRIVSDTRSVLFSLDEFKNLPSFAMRLQTQGDPMSTFLWNRFSLQTQQLLLSRDAAMEAVGTNLRRELNKVLVGDSIYEDQRFVGVTLSEETQTLMSKKLRRNEVPRLNRLLLEDFYPEQIRNVGDYLEFTPEDVLKAIRLSGKKAIAKHGQYASVAALRQLLAKKEITSKVTTLPHDSFVIFCDGAGALIDPEESLKVRHRAIAATKKDVSVEQLFDTLPEFARLKFGVTKARGLIPICKRLQLDVVSNKCPRV